MSDLSKQIRERRNALTILCDAGFEVRFEKYRDDYIARTKTDRRLGMGDWIETDGCASCDSAAKVLLRTVKERGYIKNTTQLVAGEGF